MKNYKKIYCHEGNGINYEIEIRGEKAVLKRYYTNGWQNRDYLVSDLIELSKLEALFGKKLDFEEKETFKPEWRDTAEMVWDELGRVKN